MVNQLRDGKPAARTAVSLRLVRPGGLGAVVALVADALLRVRPDGWQAKARQNAWAAMVDDARRRVERRSAHQLLAELAEAAAARPVAG